MSATQETKPLAGSLKRLAIRGSAFEGLGLVASQAIRLATNLILSRLLFPEAFGLSALVMIFSQGLVMLSDVGIEPGVVQSPRGDERLFLNTAWTLQVMRGALLFAVACLLAWPMALVYDEPQLTLLIPVGALGVLAAGFSSTSLLTLRRHVRSGTLLLIDLGSQLLGLAVMIPWAYTYPSVWALVGGGVAGSIAKAGLSYAVRTEPDGFAWDKEARDAILHFGKWIFGASALFFASKQADRLLLGKYMGTEVLGVYSIALFLSEAPGMVLVRVTDGVFYPLLSRVHREEPQRMREVFYNIRFYMDALAQTALGGLTILGVWVVDFLYDPRYHEAGWMLQAMCFRTAMTCVVAPWSTVLFSMGQTRYALYQNIVRAAWVVIGIPIAFQLYGIKGLVGVIAFTEVPVLFVFLPPLLRNRILSVVKELRAPAFFMLGCVIAYGLLQVLPDV